MHSDDKNNVLALESVETEDEESSSGSRLYLGRGRTIAVASQGADEIVEIRASSGAVELRIKLTEEGPVLQLEGVRLSVKAAESVAVQCKTFAVEASESMKLATGGDLEVKAEGEGVIESTGEMHVRGKIIHLN